MSKRDRAKKASARMARINTKKETEKMIKRIKKDQFGWQAKKVK